MMNLENIENLTTEELILLQSQTAIELAKRNPSDKHIAGCNIQFDLVYETIKSNPQLEDYHGLFIVADEDEIGVVYKGNTLYYIVKNIYCLDSLDEILEVKKLVEEVLKGTFFINKLKERVRKTGMDVKIHDIPIKVIQLADKRVIKLIGEEFTLLENRIETPITELMAQQILDKLEVM